MASISKDGQRKDGQDRYSIKYYDVDKQRRKIRLGLNRKLAERVGKVADALVTAQLCGEPVDKATAHWLQMCPDNIHAKLAERGLVEPRVRPQNHTLGSWLETHIGGRTQLKPNTKRNYEVTRQHLVNFFGADRPLQSITPGDVDAWVESLKGNGLGPQTISREVKRARQFMAAAVRSKLIAENPLTHIKAKKQSNPDRSYFVSQDEISKAIKACPDAEWRAIIALARYGGLRTPSETVSLKWEHIDWAGERFRVTSPKTEHHPGGAFRIVPLFPELRTHLEELRDQSERRADFVITRYRDKSSNLRTQFLRIIEWAGLKPWPKLFHNLRASRQTELAQCFPMHVVCKWIGNSELVARDHYLSVTEQDFKTAAALREGGPKAGPVDRDKLDQLVDLHHPARNGTETPKSSSTNDKRPSGAWPCSVVQFEIIPPRGVEPLLPD